MANTKRYPRVILGATYRTPAGVTATPISYFPHGLIVRFTGSNFDMLRAVSREDFSTYTRVVDELDALAGFNNRHED